MSDRMGFLCFQSSCPSWLPLNICRQSQDNQLKDNNNYLLSIYFYILHPYLPPQIPTTVWSRLLIPATHPIDKETKKWTDSFMATQIITGQDLNPQLTPKPVHFQLYCVNPPSLAISLRTLPVIWERISENRVLCKPLCNKRFKGSRYFDA